MKCPNCGNEVHPGEAYCGQCGTPVVPSVPSTNMTEMMSTPPSRSGLASSFLAQPPQASSSRQSGPPGTQGNPPASPLSSYNVANQQAPGTRPFPTNARPVSPQTGSFGPQADFYQDATEAFSALPGNVPQGYVPNQQTYPSTPPSNQYLPPGTAPTQYGGQTGQYGFPSQAGPQTPSFPPSFPPSYPSHPARPMPQSPQRQSGNTGLLIITILLALALIAIVGFGTLYFVRQHALQTTAQNAATATATASANTANAAANATATAATVLTPTPAATATTAPSPTPTVVPTATPDANFTYCGQPCITNGYQIEYPTGWNLTSSGDGLSILITNPAQSDIFVAFRTPSTPANSATDVVANDLQTNYASKTGYTLSPQSSTVVISGETWVQSIATYQGDTQQERIEVYGTIHAGKSFIIELQAPDAQFDQANSQYFVNVTGRYQFQP